MRREILPADRHERISVSPLAGVRAQRPASPRRRVQLGRRIAVVDEEHESALQPDRGVGGPGVEAEADLGGLAIRQADSLGRESLRQRLAGRCFGKLHEVSVPPTDEDFLEPTLALEHPVNRQGIEELVGQDAAGPCRAVAFDIGPEAVVRQTPLDRFASFDRDFDRPIAQRLLQLRPIGDQAPQDIECQDTRACAIFQETIGCRAAAELPHLVQLATDHPPEDRVGLGRRQEVAGARSAVVPGRVVATFGVIQGQLHETRERDRSGVLDLGPDCRHERTIALGQNRCLGGRKAELGDDFHWLDASGRDVRPAARRARRGCARRERWECGHPAPIR